MTSITTPSISVEATPSSLENAHCAHCGGTVPLGFKSAHQELPVQTFCCRGCEMVYTAIHGLGLGYYYRLRGAVDNGAMKDLAPPEKFQFLDDPAFQHSRVRVISDGTAQVTLQLEGIHCAACVWLIEKIPTVLQGVLSTRVEFARGLVRIAFVPSKVKLSQLVYAMHRIGYPAVVIDSDERIVDSGFNRLFLLRLGVAGFCLMNIMIMAVGIYGGEGGEIQTRYTQLFSWVSLLLCVPVVGFSAVPFFKTALGGLRGGVFHIDLPISLAIILGFALSVINTVRGNTAIYFDSISALIFLLLVGRWIQHRTLERAQAMPELMRQLLPQSVRRSSEEVVALELVQPGDELRIEAGETIAVDGIVAEGVGLVQTAFLTGEPVPRTVTTGDTVLAGSVLIEGEVVVRITATRRRSQIGTILETVELAARERPPLLIYLDAVARGFTAIVLIAGLFTFLFWIPSGLGVAAERAIALLIVTCPCVLAVAAPLTLSLAVLRAAAKRIFILSPRVLEGIVAMRHLVFDKTGTLTEGSAHCGLAYLDSAQGIDLERLKSVLMSLEGTSQHPIAHAVRLYAQGAMETPIEGAREEYANGISAQFSDGRWSIGSRSLIESLHGRLEQHVADVADSIDQRQNGAVFIAHKHDVVAVLELSDPLRRGAKDLVSNLAARGIELSLYSGDRMAPTIALADTLGIPRTQVHAELSPQQKADAVSALAEQKTTVIVGDGMNDAVAFTKAHVSIGVHGGAVQCAKSSDVFVDLKHMSQLTELFEGAQRTVGVVKRSLWISGIYNVVGGAGAVMGLLGPLEAAILMPLSSLTVISLAARSRTF